MNRNNVDGIWYYLPLVAGIKQVEFDPYYGDPDKGFLAAPYDSKWTGYFTGKSKDYGLAITHGPSPVIFLDAVSFESVKVGDVSGGLHLDVMGTWYAEDSEWRGTWTITGGTGELKKLQGHGIFWGPGWLGDPEEYGVIYYSVEEMDGIEFKNTD
jgi:hypothetical protein